MEWKWNYGQGVLVLPASVLGLNATPEQLRVLLWIASDASLIEKPTLLAKAADATKSEVSEAIDFWREAGVISTEREPLHTPTEKPKKQPTAKAADKQPPKAEKRILQRADEFPAYSTTEMADMLERRESLRVLVDESQNIFGKMFNAHELNILFGLVDYLNLDEEYILILLAHCKRIEIKSLRQVEKYAITLIDQGVTSPEALDEQVKLLEARHTLEGKVRSMFGIQRRALTAKESKMLNAWISYGYGEDVILMAYEITVNATQEPSVPYANAIMEKWHSEGLTTADEIDRYLVKERAAREGSNPAQLGTSFDVNDFFNAALERSFRKSEDKI